MSATIQSYWPPQDEDGWTYNSVTLSWWKEVGGISIGVSMEGKESFAWSAGDSNRGCFDGENAQFKAREAAEAIARIEHKA